MCSSYRFSPLSDGYYGDWSPISILLPVKELLIYLSLHNNVFCTFLRFFTAQVYTFLRFFSNSIGTKSFKFP